MRNSKFIRSYLLDKELVEYQLNELLGTPDSLINAYKLNRYYSKGISDAVGYMMFRSLHDKITKK